MSRHSTITATPSAWRMTRCARSNIHTANSCATVRFFPTPTKRNSRKSTTSLPTSTSNSTRTCSTPTTPLKSLWRMRLTWPAYQHLQLRTPLQKPKNAEKRASGYSPYMHLHAFRYSSMPTTALSARKCGKATPATHRAAKTTTVP